MKTYQNVAELQQIVLERGQNESAVCTGRSRLRFVNVLRMFCETKRNVKGWAVFSVAAIFTVLCYHAWWFSLWLVDINSEWLPHQLYQTRSYRNPTFLPHETCLLPYAKFSCDSFWIRSDPFCYVFVCDFASWYRAKPVHVSITAVCAPVPPLCALSRRWQYRCWLSRCWQYRCWVLTVSMLTFLVLTVSMLTVSELTVSELTVSVLTVCADSIGADCLGADCLGADSLCWQYRCWLSRGWLSRCWHSRCWQSRCWLSRGWLSRGWLSRCWLSVLTASVLIVSVLTVSVLTVSVLIVSVLTVSVLTISVLTVSMLTVSVLTVSMLTISVLTVRCWQPRCWLSRCWLLTLPTAAGDPLVREMPDVTAIEGEAIYITCSVGGYPIHQVTWIRGECTIQCTISLDRSSTTPPRMLSDSRWVLEGEKLGRRKLYSFLRSLQFRFISAIHGMTGAECSVLE